jgi:hypothetical protein
MDTLGVERMRPSRCGKYFGKSREIQEINRRIHKTNELAQQHSIRCHFDTKRMVADFKQKQSVSHHQKQNRIISFWTSLEPLYQIMKQREITTLTGR